MLDFFAGIFDPNPMQLNDLLLEMMPGVFNSINFLSLDNISVWAASHICSKVIEKIQPVSFYPNSFWQSEELSHVMQDIYCWLFVHSVEKLWISTFKTAFSSCYACKCSHCKWFFLLWFENAVKFNGFIFINSAWLWVLGGLPMNQRQEIYGASILLGLGCSTLLVTSLAMTAELVGDNTVSNCQRFKYYSAFFGFVWPHRRINDW